MDPYCTFLYNNPKMSDITFLVGDKKYYGHRLILSCGSDVFSTMFYGKIPYKEDSIIFVDSNIKTFEIFLKFVYHMSVDLTGNEMNDVLGALKLTHQYMLDNPTTILVKHVLENLTVDYVVLVWELGFFYTQISQKTCLEYAFQHCKTLLNSVAFLEASENFLIAFLESENLAISEFEIFNCLLKWAQHKLPNVGDNKELIKKFASIFDLVRYPLIPVKEFYDSIVAKELLSDKDCMTVLACMAGANLDCRFKSQPRLEDKPTNLIISTDYNGQKILKWDPVSLPNKGYKIEMKNRNQSNWQYMDTVKTNQLILSVFYDYTFRVSALPINSTRPLNWAYMNS